jgi:hypothetical protein
VTKRRPPLTFENALTKTAAIIGWEEVARILGLAERTVRRWSEPDTTASITLEAALKLDIAVIDAGGDEAPFLLCYATRVDMESLAASPGRDALIAAAAEAARESGEAVAAALTAARPGASEADIILAERELEESIAAKTRLLKAVRAARRWLERWFHHQVPEEGAEETVRAPEVAQPIES